MSEIEVGMLVRIAVKNDGNLTRKHVKEFTGRVEAIGPTGRILRVKLAPAFKASRYVNLDFEAAEAL